MNSVPMLYQLLSSGHLARKEYHWISCLDSNKEGSAGVQGHNIYSCGLWEVPFEEYFSCTNLFIQAGLKVTFHVINSHSILGPLGATDIWNYRT